MHPPKIRDRHREDTHVERQKLYEERRREQQVRITIWVSKAAEHGMDVLRGNESRTTWINRAISELTLRQILGKQFPFTDDEYVRAVQLGRERGIDLSEQTGTSGMGIDGTRDPIKGVGFVTIYFANLEDALDGLLKDIRPYFDTSEVLAKWQFASRVDWLKKTVKKTVAKIQPMTTEAEEDAHYIAKLLNDALRAATERNRLIHLPIFSDRRGGALRKTQEGNKEPVDSAAIYQLGENICYLYGEIGGLRPRLTRLLAAANA